ncbi:MAG TPA: hypothetical protein PLD53_07830 [Candidatus Propionivibrio aalborgensis]|nr:hypothetical protein [Candidatus Propionivibrio aalborgensis]
MMNTRTEPDNRSANYGPAMQAGNTEKPFIVAGNDDYQQMVAEAAFIEAQRRATELVLSGSGRHEF